MSTSKEPLPPSDGAYADTLPAEKNLSLTFDLEESSYPACLLQPDGTILRMNRSCLAWLAFEQLPTPLPSIQSLLESPQHAAFLLSSSPPPASTLLRLRRQDGVLLQSQLLHLQLPNEHHPQILLFFLPVDDPTPLLPHDPQLFRLLIEQASELIAFHAPSGRFQYVNPACVQLLGYTPTELLQKELQELLPLQSDAESLQWAFAQALAGDSLQLCVRVRHKAGDDLWFEISLRPLVDANGQTIGVQSTAHNVTARKQNEQSMRSRIERLQDLSQQDPLTGLPNRVLFRDRLERAILRARQQKEMLAILYFDLDRFQRINDTFGHNDGDRLLRAVAQRLQQCTREDDTITRLGGDEFALLLPALEETQMAVRIVQTILASMKQPFALQGHEVFLTASIGISLFPLDGSSPESLLKHAYHAMYQAKERGKNTFHLHAPAMNVAALERLAFENNLRRALEREQLVLYYQPQVAIVNEAHAESSAASSSYRIVGAEALLRWQHPELGLISPGRFIPVAEASGMIVAMGEWVLREACRQNKAWQDAGFPPLRVSVNLSPWQFQRPNLIDLIAEILDETGLDPQYLELEITENVFMQHEEDTREKMRILHQMGVHIAIDDFGTGYSSLLYLKRFPIQILKIDQSFIQNLDDDPNDTAITKGIIALAHSLDLTVVAEGVHAHNQLNYLRSLGCDRIQGYLFSPPVPPPAFQQLLQQKPFLPLS